MTNSKTNPTQAGTLGRPLMVGDPVFHAEKHHWGLGIVQSISDEVNSVTCGWWSDVGYFQAGSPSKRLVHVAAARHRLASTAGDTLKAELDAVKAERDRYKEALEWYAEPVLAYAITQANEPRSAVHADKGQRARTALGSDQ